MNEEEFLDRYVRPFPGVSYIFRADVGYIVWRNGTGHNTELLHIRSFVHRRGYASLLVKEMLERLAADPPYHSVYGFMLDSNEAVKAMYRKLGFNLAEGIPGPYKGGDAALCWQSYENLRAQLGLLP